MVHRAGCLRLAFASLLAGSAQAASPSSITLSASPNPAVYGSPVALTATASPAVATGKVTFYQGLSVVGIASLSAGKATLNTKSLAWGGQPLKAHYAGDRAFGPSTSVAVPMVVKTVAAQGFSQTSVSSNSPLQFPALASGDFNGDGRMDVAATGAGNGATAVAIFLGNGDGTFLAGPTYGGIVTASSIVAADFNGDGKTDLAIMDAGASTLRVMLGNGDGSFQAAVNYPVAGSHLVIGDFNGDGIVDIATAEPAYANSSISVLLGNGDGTFAAPVTRQIPGGVDTLMVADVNGDGIADLVILLGTNNVEVFLGKGDGSFAQTGNPITLDQQVVDIAAGDFNLDGRTDLIVSNGGGVSLLLGNGDGTFQQPKYFAVGRPTYTLGVTDVNGDGNPDVIVGTGYPTSPNGVWGSFAVLLGDGSGSLQLNGFHDNVAGWGPFVIGDFNGDGRVDIAEGLSNLAVYLGLGPTDLSVTIIHSGNFQQGQAGAVFTSTVGDLGPSPMSGLVTLSFGLPDALSLVGASGSGWNCNGTACTRSDPLEEGTSYPPLTLTVNVSLSAPASVTVTATVSIAGQSDPNPAEDTASDSVTIIQYQTIVFGTLPDLVFGAPPFTLAATATSGLPVTYSASGNCTVNGSTVTLTATGSCAITASQAGNSLYLPAPDVVRAFIIGSAATSVGLNVAPGSSTFGAPVTLTATVNPGAAQGRTVFYDGVTVLGSANLKQGAAKLVVHPTGTGVRRMYARYIGVAPWPGSVSAAVALTVTSVPAFNFPAVAVSGNMPFYDVAAGDFNGDGIPDIVAGTSGFIEVFLGDGTGHFGAPIQTSVSSAGQIGHVAVGDFNADGKLDIAIAAQPSPQGQNVSVWFGRGDGTFAPGPVFAIPGVSLAVADFNGDGFVDLAIGQGPTPVVSILLNKGDGTFETPIEYPVSGDMHGVLLAAADVNQDGNADLIAVTGVFDPNTTDTDNRISLLLGRGDGTFLQPAGWVDDPVGAITGPGAVAVGDLNGDGISDLAIANAFSYGPYRCSITTLVGNGDGTFQPPAWSLCSDTSQTSAGGSPGGIVIADLTGDGKADVAALYAYNQGFLQLFQGNGDGTFQAASVYQYSGATVLSPLAMADFNGDGRVDFAGGGLVGVSLIEGAAGPFLRIAKTHTGGLTGPNHTYTIAVANASAASTTSGEIDVTDSSPIYSQSLTLTGPGWNCAGITCSRSDPLAGGSSYPPITAELQLDPTLGFSTLTNHAAVSGGGSPPAESTATVPLAPSNVPLILGLDTAGASPATLPRVSPNDWIEIYGTNLVPVSTPASGVNWSNAPEFASGEMPTQLSGVSVTVNGKPAYVDFYCSAAASSFCSTDQVNVLTPLDDPLVGPVQIVVTSSSGVSSAFTASLNAVSPSFLRFGERYVAATHANYSLLGPTTLYPGLSTPAKRGEVVLLWAVGFGLPAEPLTPGSSSQFGVMPETPTCTVGGNAASVLINLVSPGLYQLNLTVPPEARSGDNPLTCIYSGAATPDGTLLAIE